MLGFTYHRPLNGSAMEACCHLEAGRICLLQTHSLMRRKLQTPPNAKTRAMSIACRQGFSSPDIWNLSDWSRRGGLRIKRDVHAAGMDQEGSGSDELTAKRLTMQNILGDNYHLHIPLWQRQYNWDADNMEQLIEDLQQNLPEQVTDETVITDLDTMELGHGILLKQSSDQNCNKYTVVDGKQRLISLTMLLAAMRRRMKQWEHPEDKGNKMAKAIATKLFQEEDLGLSPERPEGPRVVVQKLTEDLYNSILTCNTLEFHKLSSKSRDEESALILSNARLAQKSVDAMDFDQVVVLFKYILNNCFLLSQETGSIRLAIQMYTSQTDKGKNMQASDILKGKLGEYLVSEEEHNTSELEQFAAKWQAMETRLGRDELQQFVSLIIKLRDLQEKPTTKRSSKNELQAVLDFAKKLEVTPGGARLYALHTLPAMYDSYMRLTESSLRLMSEPANVDSETVEIENRIHLLLVFMNQITATYNDWMIAAMVLLYQWQENKDNWPLAKVRIHLEDIERVAAYHYVCAVKGVDREKRFFQIAVQLNDAVVKDPNDGLLSLTYSEKKTFREKVTGPGLYKPRGRNYAAKYILMRADAELRQSNPPKQLYAGKKVTIDHILPQNPAEDCPGFFGFDDSKIRDEVTSQLGNLTLINGARNSAAGNSSYKVKLDKFTVHRGDSSKRVINEFAITEELIRQHPEKWDLEAFRQRHADLVDLVCGEHCWKLL